MRKLIKTLCQATLSGMFLCGLTLESRGIVLAEKGQAKAVIVYDKKAPEVVRFAARELQTHLERMSGARLSLLEWDGQTDFKTLAGATNMIALGETPLSKELGISRENLQPDGFRIVTRPQALVIAGYDDADTRPEQTSALGAAGTLYGAYRLLEELGVRWFFPGDDCTVIPSCPTIAIKLDVKDAPFCVARRGESPDNTPTAKLWARRVRFGGTSEYYGPHVTFGNWMGTYDLFHPEMIALKADGTRGGNICWTHPHSRERMIFEAKKYFQGLSGLDAQRYPCFGISDLDGGPPICLCPECQRQVTPERGFFGTSSEYVAGAAVDVAEATLKEYPDGIILIHAYNRHKLSPLKIKQFPQNMGVRFSRNTILNFSESSTLSFHKAVESWLKLKPRVISLGDHYNHDCWGKKYQGIPAMFTRLIGEDARYLMDVTQKYGASYKGEVVFTDGMERRLSAGSQAAAEIFSKRFWWLCPNLYVKARLLWDPKTSPSGVMKDFYERGFGKAAGPMEKMYSRMEEIWCTPKWKWSGGVEAREGLVEKDMLKGEFFTGDPWVTLFPPQVLFELAGYLAEAHRLATPDCKARLNVVDNGFLFTISEARKHYSDSARDLFDEIEQCAKSGYCP